MPRPAPRPGGSRPHGLGHLFGRAILSVGRQLGVARPPGPREQQRPIARDPARGATNSAHYRGGRQGKEVALEGTDSKGKGHVKFKSRPRRGSWGERLASGQAARPSGFAHGGTPKLGGHRASSRLEHGPAPPKGRGAARVQAGRSAIGSRGSDRGRGEPSRRPALPCRPPSSSRMSSGTLSGRDRGVVERPGGQAAEGHRTARRPRLGPECMRPLATAGLKALGRGRRCSTRLLAPV